MLPSLLLAALPLVAAAPWAQPDNSPVHELFKRQNGPKPASEYPPALQVPSGNFVRQEWIDKLKAVEGSFRKVDVSLPANGTDNAVVYPGNPSQAQLNDKNGICAFPVGCKADDDIWGAPNGAFMITFDDGPGEGSKMLSDFLETKNMSTHATHFMIGASIVAEQDNFQYVFSRGGHIASHTWSHKRMTTLTNEQIVAELGWTMQAIADQTGGRLPLYWRPPYGDIDNRVRDVASKVFGLKAVLWNADSNDWRIASEGKAPTEKEFDTWAAWDKSTKGINALMHEINKGTVEIFIVKYDNFVKNGWKVQNVAEAEGTPMYFNSADNKAEVKQMTIKELGAQPVAPAPNSTTSGGAGGSNSTASPNGNAAPSNKPGSSANGLLAPLATVVFASLAAALF